MSSNPSEEIAFSPRRSVEQVEEGLELSPKFDEHGLIPVITSAEDGEVLMLGYMNADALKRSIATGEAHYYSRARKKLWRKGETSGLTQKIVEMRIDDDQDALWLKVKVAGSGGSCHVGYRSCFYRRIEGGEKATALIFTESEKNFDPAEVYGDIPNPTEL